jgi:dephospho-CoA kinase
VIRKWSISVEKMLVVGLTGGIGAGKSTVAGMLAAKGAAVIDVDRLGHVVLEPGGKAHDAVLDSFGTVDRRELGAIVFADPEALARLTAISHPAINAELVEVLAGVDDEVVVLDMAILAESILGRGVYEVVVTVEAPVEMRVARAVARGMAEVDVRRRIAAQASEAERRQLAQHVIVNDGSEAELVAQVAQCWAALTG